MFDLISLHLPVAFLVNLSLLHIMPEQMVGRLRMSMRLPGNITRRCGKARKYLVQPECCSLDIIKMLLSSLNVDVGGFAKVMPWGLQVAWEGLVVVHVADGRSDVA